MVASRIQSGGKRTLRYTTYVRWFVRLLTLTLTTTALAYLSEMHSWHKFLLAAAASIVLQAIDWALDARPIAAYFQKLEKRDFDLVQRMNASGFLEFYDMQDPAQQDRRNADTRDAIERADVMHLSANSGASYIDPGVERHWPAIKKRLADGTILNIVLLDPFSREKAVRDGLNIVGESRDSKFRFDLLCQLYNKYPNVNIRIASAQMYNTLFLTESEAFYDPYHLGKLHDRITNRFLCLRFSKLDPQPNRDSQYVVLKQHFDSLWLMSKDFEAYFLENAARIRGADPGAAITCYRHRHETEIT